MPAIGQTAAASSMVAHWRDESVQVLVVGVSIAVGQR